MNPRARVEGWLQERFPRHPHIYFGISGATLLYEALRKEARSSLLFPAFICPALPMMAMQAGKSVVHIDVDPATMHPAPGATESWLDRHQAADCAVLIDHSFGYPYGELAALRKRFPELLVVEDCARALGAAVRGKNPGEHSDWILFSMYKTITGSQNGAVLLSRKPLALREHPPGRITLRERAALLRPLRSLYDLARRGRGNFDAPQGILEAPGWTPATGSPNALCLARFAGELDRLDSRPPIAAELTAALARFDHLECIRVDEGSQQAGNFVSFKMRNREQRDGMLRSLQRQGLFLSRTWEFLPSNYAVFAGTFAGGDAGSIELWNRIVHIPVRFFAREERRRLLLREIAKRGAPPD